MESARQNQIIISADFVQTALVESSVVDQASRLVYDDESEDGPGGVHISSVKRSIEPLMRRPDVHGGYLISWLKGGFS